MPALSPYLLAVFLAGSGLALGFTYLTRRNPRFGVLVSLLVLAFVPIWVSVPIVVAFPLVALAIIGTLAAVLSVRRPPLRYTLADLAIASLFVVAVAPYAIGRLSLPALFGVFTVWIPSFMLGRLVTPRVGEGWIFGVIAVVFAIVGGLAVLEFITEWHPLAQWGPSNSARVAWGSIQSRGGLVRSEGAFGHSIALGCSLAMAAVCSLASPFRPGLKLLLTGLQVAGAAVTLSRLGIICTMLGLVLAVLVLKNAMSRALRWWVAVILAGATATLLPVFSGVLAVSQEAAGSAAYRGNLLSLIPFIDVLGTSSAMQVSANGTLYFGGFRSIDSQLMLFGLSYGWVTLAIVISLLGAAGFAVVKGDASAATVAVVAQIPALTSVALITQYAYFFWFMVGVAAASQAARRVGESRATGSTHASSRRDPAAAIGGPSREGSNRG